MRLLLSFPELAASHLPLAAPNDQSPVITLGAVLLARIDDVGHETMSSSNVGAFTL